MGQPEVLLEIKDLCVEFQTVEGTVRAVNHLNYTLHKGEKLGIVGESGSGKSVSSLGMLQLIPNPPGRITGGEILYKGQDLVKASEKEMQKIRENCLIISRRVPTGKIPSPTVIFPNSRRTLPLLCMGLTGNTSTRYTISATMWRAWQSSLRIIIFWRMRTR